MVICEGKNSLVQYVRFITKGSQENYDQIKNYVTPHVQYNYHMKLFTHLILRQVKWRRIL